MPIKNLVIGKKYRINFKFKIENAEYSTGSYINTWKVSDEDIVGNFQGNYINKLSKDVNEYSCTNDIIASAENMYINFDLCGLVDGKTFTIIIDEESIIPIL